MNKIIVVFCLLLVTSCSSISKKHDTSVMDSETRVKDKSTTITEKETVKYSADGKIKETKKEVITQKLDVDVQGKISTENTQETETILKDWKYYLTRILLFLGVIGVVFLVVRFRLWRIFGKLLSLLCWQLLFFLFPYL